MIEQLHQTPVTFIVIYGLLATIFTYEAWMAIRRMRIMHICGLTKFEAPLYTYYMAIAIGMALMSVRTVSNILGCDVIMMTILRVITNAMIAFIVHLGSNMLWIVKVETQYTLWPRHKSR